VDDTTALTLDTSPGLVRSASAHGSILWRVELQGTLNRPSRARLLSQDGKVLGAVPTSGARQTSDQPTVDATLAPARSERTLVLAQSFNSGWQATIDGQPLNPIVYDGWAQAFAIPTPGGHLIVAYQHWSGEWLVPSQITLALVALVLALIGALPRRRMAALLAPRFTRPVPRLSGEDEGTAIRPRPLVFDDDHPEHDEVAPIWSSEEVDQ
jgi:hypothetical protein